MLPASSTARSRAPDLSSHFAGLRLAWLCLQAVLPGVLNPSLHVFLRLGWVLIFLPSQLAKGAPRGTPVSHTSPAALRHSSLTSRQ